MSERVSTGHVAVHSVDDDELTWIVYVPPGVMGGGSCDASSLDVPCGAMSAGKETASNSSGRRCGPP